MADRSHFFNPQIDDEGNALAGIQVTVTNLETDSAANIYTSREGGTPKDNPFLTVGDINDEFFADSGKYQIDYTDTEIPPRVEDRTIYWTGNDDISGGGSSAEIMVGDSDGNMRPVEMSGDATIDSDGSVTIDIPSDVSAVYRTIVSNHSVVNVSSAKKDTVYILGSTKHRGEIPIEDSETVMITDAEKTKFPFFFYLDPSDYSISGKDTKLRLRISLILSDWLDSGDEFLFNIAPVTTDSTAGARINFNMGTELLGESISIAQPGKGTITTEVSDDFDIPESPGLYGMTIKFIDTTNDGLTIGSTIYALGELQLHHVDS